MPQLNTIFSDITSFHMLWAGWQKVKSRRGGPGGDLETISTFDEQAEARIETLQQSLASNTYWPRPARPVQITKPSGGLRELIIPSVTDRVVQTAAALVLTQILDREFEESSFGYRPGRSVKQAVARVAALRNQGYVWTVDGDIRAFFDTVPHDPLLDKFEVVTKCDRTTDLIGRWLETYRPNGKGLPQGMPISPLLSNLYLDEIDEKIEKGGVRLVRFADDFLLLCKSEMGAEGAMGRIADLLHKAGLELHPEKTSIRRFEDSTRFLGHLFVRGLVMEDFEDDIADEVPPPSSNWKTTEVSPPASAEPIEDDTDGAYSHRLRWVYVHEPGRRVEARGNGFSVRDSDQGREIALVHPTWPDGFEIGPAAQIDNGAIRLALTARLPVNFVDASGELLGSLEAPISDRADLHLRQAAFVLDPERRLDMARRCVRGRIANQRATLIRLNSKRGIEKVETALDAMADSLARLPLRNTVDEVMGAEGRATSVYWSAVAALLDPEIGFKGRERRPPPDPYNLVVSYLSTRLASDMAALIKRRGLHPGFACLHANQDGRASLALDLMEEFRAPLVEGTAVTLFRQKRLKPDQFVAVDSGMRASPDAFRAMITGYETRLNTRLKTPSGRWTNWRGVMEAQVLSFADEVRGKGAYAPYVRET